MTLSDGAVVHAVLVPGKSINLIVWYRNGAVEGAEEFLDRHRALARADDICADLALQHPRTQPEKPSLTPRLDESLCL